MIIEPYWTKDANIKLVPEFEPHDSVKVSIRFDDKYLDIELKNKPTETNGSKDVISKEDKETKNDIGYLEGVGERQIVGKADRGKQVIRITTEKTGVTWRFVWGLTIYTLAQVKETCETIEGAKKDGTRFAFALLYGDESQFGNMDEYHEATVYAPELDRVAYRNNAGRELPWKLWKNGEIIYTPTNRTLLIYGKLLWFMDIFGCDHTDKIVRRLCAPIMESAGWYEESATSEKRNDPCYLCDTHDVITDSQRELHVVLRKEIFLLFSSSPSPQKVIVRRSFLETEISSERGEGQGDGRDPGFHGYAFAFTGQNSIKSIIVNNIGGRLSRTPVPTVDLIMPGWFTRNIRCENESIRVPSIVIKMNPDVAQLTGNYVWRCFDKQNYVCGVYEYSRKGSALAQRRTFVARISIEAYNNAYDEQYEETARTWKGPPVVSPVRERHLLILKDFVVSGRLNAAVEVPAKDITIVEIRPVQQTTKMFSGGRNVRTTKNRRSEKRHK